MLGERLADVRKDHGDTQNDLAEKIHVALTTVRSWEQERSSPSHDYLVAICRLYHVSSDYLLGITNSDPLLEEKRRSERFTQEERDEIKKYEEFLLYKRRKK